MTQQEIHQIFLQAAIACAEKGADAKDLAEYMEVATKGMKINAAFCVSAKNLAENLKTEIEG